MIYLSSENIVFRDVSPQLPARMISLNIKLKLIICVFFVVFHPLKGDENKVLHTVRGWESRQKICKSISQSSWSSRRHDLSCLFCHTYLKKWHRYRLNSLCNYQEAFCAVGLVERVALEGQII